MCHPFFDELRDPNTKLPDSRHPEAAPRDLPNLFDFSRHGMFFSILFLVSSFEYWQSLLELSIAPSMNHRLVPPHARPALAARGLDIDSFKPLSKEQMMARLDWVWVWCSRIVRLFRVLFFAYVRGEGKGMPFSSTVMQYEFFFFSYLASGGFWVWKRFLRICSPLSFGEASESWFLWGRSKGKKRRKTTKKRSVIHVMMVGKWNHDISRMGGWDL